eukprot:352309-Chlamydomonas_euryale.AAC.1
MLPGVGGGAGSSASAPASAAGAGAAGGVGGAPHDDGSAAAAAAHPPLPAPSADLTTLVYFCTRVRMQHRRCASLVAGGARMAPMADESAGALCSTCYGVCCMAFALDDAGGAGSGVPPPMPRCLTCKMCDRGSGGGGGGTVYLHPTTKVYEAWCGVMEPAVQLVEGGLLGQLAALGVSESQRFGEPGGAAGELPADAHPWAWVELMGAGPLVAAAAADTSGASASAPAASEPAS